MSPRRWRCLENGRVYPETPWLRLKFHFWAPLASRYAWPHRLCRHYIKEKP